MVTITAQRTVKFTASAGLDITHLKFTKSHNVVILQTLQERSVTVKRTKKRRKHGEHRVNMECHLHTFKMV